MTIATAVSRVARVVLPGLLATALVVAVPARAAQPARGQEPTQQEPAPQQPQEPAEGQAPPTVEQLAELESILEYIEVLPASEAAIFRFHNREITTLRAQVLGRDPAERARNATERLNEVLDRGGAHQVELFPVQTAILIRVDGAAVLAIVEQDVDLLASETVPERARAAATLLQIALREAQELRNPAIMLGAVARVALATLVFAAVLVVLMRVRRRLVRSLYTVAKQYRTDNSVAGRILWAEVRLDVLARRLALVLSGAVILVTSYAWLTHSLRQFPYTRPWGEALGDRLLGLLGRLAAGMFNAIPGLVSILVVVLLTRMLTRVVRAFFAAVRDGRIRFAGLDAEAARPTQQIAIAVLWILALVVCYPYIPGSGTEAFRGISVFLGIVLSIGSTGIVNQAMSGLILMYSSSMRPGEYVACGNVEGTVMQLGALSIRIRTLHRELVTVPNSVMLLHETTNYSRLSGHGVPVKTGITLGYSVPWRQVHAILRLAAERTEDVRAEPEPIVLQRTLSDFYVGYELVAYVDDPRSRPRVLTELHANILDLCNEYGVQILSPHYMVDPQHPALVPPGQWNTPPARTERERLDDHESERPETTATETESSIPPDAIPTRPGNEDD